MHTTLCRLVLLAIVTMTNVSNAVQYTVCKSGDCNFNSIQYAVNMAGKQDVILIMDSAVYEEQVTIDSTKGGLVLRSENPSSTNKPTIRYKDVTNTHPKTYQETQTDSTITYCQNGALRIIGAANIKIEGIIIDGGGAQPFAYNAVWGGSTPFFHGNSALVLDIAGDCIVRDCDLQNAYFGIFCYDRNKGGVFARANPADFDTQDVVPFSSFARAGNHLFEYNRIHNNTWGVYFESMWDLGSTMRYNLIYDNHHASDAAAAGVAAMPGGKDQAGGAVLFKDVRYAPMAIYNNTFWHNYLNFARLSGAGAHHLIFNNIYGRPFRLWTDDPNFPNPTVASDQLFVNRMFNSIYSPQAEQPETVQVRIIDSIYDAGAGNYIRIDTTITAVSRMRIMPGMEQVKKGMEIALTVHMTSKDTVLRRIVDNAIQPGNPITAGTTLKPFPESSNVRWAEIHFLSTDPSSGEFLVPDWSNKLVKQFVIDQGWQESGVRDVDGTRADIGAIPSGRDRPADIVTVRPTRPVEIRGSTAIINFEITPRLQNTPPTDFKIVYFYAVTKLDTADVFGATYKAMASTNITKIAIPAKKLAIGANTIEVPVSGAGDFAFFEMIIEMMDSNQSPFTSAVGFLPYRKLEYLLDVTVLDKVGGTPVSSVRAGQPVILEVTARNGNDPFANLVDPTEIYLQSRFNVLNPAGNIVSSIPNGIRGTANTDIVFTRVPFGGVEYVQVAGRWIHENRVIAFLGSSRGITIRPGPADSIVILNTEEEMYHPGSTAKIRICVLDKFGNSVDSPTSIRCQTTNPNNATISDSETVTDSAGNAVFQLEVTGVDSSRTIKVIATIASSNKQDTLFLTILAIAVTMPHTSPFYTPHPVLCELIDLRGKVLRRETIDSRSVSRGMLPFFVATGRGMYILRTTDLAKGTVQNERRLLLTR